MSEPQTGKTQRNPYQDISVSNFQKLKTKKKFLKVAEILKSSLSIGGKAIQMMVDFSSEPCRS